MTSNFVHSASWYVVPFNTNVCYWWVFHIQLRLRCAYRQGQVGFTLVTCCFTEFVKRKPLPPINKNFCKPDNVGEICQFVEEYCSRLSWGSVADRWNPSSGVICICFTFFIFNTGRLIETHNGFNARLEWEQTGAQKCNSKHVCTFCWRWLLPMAMGRMPPDFL